MNLRGFWTTWIHWPFRSRVRRVHAASTLWVCDTDSCIRAVVGPRRTRYGRRIWWSPLPCSDSDGFSREGKRALARTCRRPHLGTVLAFWCRVFWRLGTRLCSSLRSTCSRTVCMWSSCQSLGSSSTINNTSY